MSGALPAAAAPRGVHPAAARVFRPWKNGGGQTAEILAHPPGAGFDAFDWRLSTAVVAADGPFSAFAGIDRVLTVIEGGPMRLSLAGAPHLLDAASPPLGFAGDVDCDATLCGPPVLDFNVMVRRPLRATVTRGPLDPAAGTRAAGSAEDGAQPAAAPEARLALLLEPAAGLERLDLIDLDAADPALTARLAGAPVLTVIIS